ncbi:hypothetical protein [Bacillus thuringiensis]|uniref:hypothetical protein n=1 Tax=Bacillus thuringiensis TaxID=1428 RepID=UPI001CFB91F8|nr:hypothetical protein [Bacillus thuringiensis]
MSAKTSQSSGLVANFGEDIAETLRSPSLPFVTRSGTVGKIDEALQNLANIAVYYVTNFTKYGNIEE